VLPARGGDPGQRGGGAAAQPAPHRAAGRAHRTARRYAGARRRADRAAVAAPARHRRDVPGGAAAPRLIGTGTLAGMDDALDVLRTSGGETVLNVGCGPGRWLAALRRRGHTGCLLGVDISPGMAAAAAERSG